MATFRKRGNRWQVQIRKQDHAPLSASFRTKGEAQTWATEQESKINKGSVIDTSDTTLADLIDEFREERDVVTYQ